MLRLSLSALSILFLLFLPVAWLGAEGKKQPPKEAGGEAARVNGTVITLADVERQILSFQHRYQSQRLNLTEEQMTMARQKILEGLIDRRLISLATSTAGYSADPARVEERFAQYKSQFSGEEELNRTLTEQGLTLEIIRSDFEEFLAIQDYLEKEVYETIEVREGDIRDYYDTNLGRFEQPEEVRASHILLKMEPEADAEIRKEVEGRMTTIQERLTSGEDFSALAVELSEGPSAPRGGDLGFFGRGAMVPEFEKAAFALKIGEVSAVVETSYGLHLIKLKDRKEAKTATFEEAKDQIVQFLTEEKAQGIIADLLSKEKEAAEIEIFMELPSPSDETRIP